MSAVALCAPYSIRGAGTYLFGGAGMGTRARARGATRRYGVVSWALARLIGTASRSNSRCRLDMIYHLKKLLFRCSSAVNLPFICVCCFFHLRGVRCAPVAQATDALSAADARCDLDRCTVDAAPRPRRGSRGPRVRRARVRRHCSSDAGHK